MPMVTKNSTMTFSVPEESSGSVFTSPLTKIWFPLPGLRLYRISVSRLLRKKYTDFYFELLPDIVFTTDDEALTNHIVNQSEEWIRMQNLQTELSDPYSLKILIFQEKAALIAAFPLNSLIGFLINFMYCFLSHSISFVRYRSTGSVAIENTTKSIMHFLDIPVIANNCGRKILHPNSPDHASDPDDHTQCIHRLADPVKDHESDNCKQHRRRRRNIFGCNPNVCPNTTSAPTASTSVSPAGSAFKNTLVRKCPLMISRFGCSARKNAGIPIVYMLISDTWDGSSG